METAIRVFLTSGYLVTVILFFIISVGICYFHGLFWRKVLKAGWSFFELFGIGFVSVLAITEAVGWPFIAFRLSSAGFTVTAVLTLIAPAAAGLLLPGGLLPAGEREERVSWVILLPVVLLLVFNIGRSVLALKFNNDDAFYVANTALFTVSDIMNPYDSSMGDVTTGTVPMYDFQIWEGLLSVPCRLFGLSAAETMHTLVVAPIIFCAASAVFGLGKALFGDRKRATVFLGMSLLFILCSRYHYDSPESFLQRRTWQGKTVNVNIVLPVLSASLIRLFDEPGRRGKGFEMPLMCVLAGMAVNPTSLYVNGFQILFLSISLMIRTRQVRKGAALIPAILATLVFTVMIYLRTRACAGKIESASIVGDTFFLDTLEDFFGENLWLTVVFACGMIYLLIWGDARIRSCFGLPCLLMLVFLWNPWSGRFVAEKITKEPTYWRVFWLMPLGPVTAWAATDLVFRPKRAWTAAVAVVLAAAVMLFGAKWDVAYEFTPNPENLEEIYLDLGRYITAEEIRTPVLAAQDVSTRLRQKFTDIQLLVAKRHYVEDVYTYFGREEEGNDRLKLYDFANRKLKGEFDGVDELLRKYGVECVILSKKNKNGIQYLTDHGYTEVSRQGIFRVYRVAETP